MLCYPDLGSLKHPFPSSSTMGNPENCRPAKKIARITKQKTKKNTYKILF